MKWEKEHCWRRTGFEREFCFTSSWLIRRLFEFPPGPCRPWVLRRRTKNRGGSLASIPPRSNTVWKVRHLWSPGAVNEGSSPTADKSVASRLPWWWYRCCDPPARIPRVLPNHGTNRSLSDLRATNASGSELDFLNARDGSSDLLSPLLQQFKTKIRKSRCEMKKQNYCLILRSFGWGFARQVLKWG